MSSTHSSESSDTAVDALMNFASEIFDEHYVMDMGLRRRIITEMISRGKIFEQVDHSYDIASFLSGHSSGAIADPTALKRNAVTVTASLKQSQQADLSRWNPDLDIKFLPATLESHPVAYAQRQIDTERCLSLLHLKRGPILDLGGNWLTNAQRQARVEIHSCNLCDSEMEAHRQTQRHALAELRDMPIGEDAFCTGGAVNCDFKAVEGISIHVLPEIDPDDIPRIFERHGLQFMVGVHHYDPNIETEDSGFIPAMNMMWQLRNDGNVIFRFEGEGSHPYIHRKSWLLEYGRCWVRTIPDWDYVVYYAVDYIRHGVLKWTMMRMQKATLGAQQLRPQFRFLEHPGTVELVVPNFDPRLGFADSDPRAYEKPRVVQVPQTMFAEVYRIGVSNETSRPDKPLTLEDIRNEVHNFNTVRYVSGTNVTIPYKLDTEIVNDIALGMYLLIVRRAAQNSLTVGHFSRQMKELQAKWRGTTMLQLLFRATHEYMVWPLLSPFTTSFDMAVSAMAMYMRRTVQSTYALASATEFVPYRVLPPIRSVSGSGDRGILPTTTEGYDDGSADFQEDITQERFLELFGELMPKDLRDKARAAAETMAAEDSARPVPHPVSADAIRCDPIVEMPRIIEMPTFEEVHHIRTAFGDAVKVAGAEAYTRDVEKAMNILKERTLVDADRRVLRMPREGTLLQVNKYSREKVYEYGVYNIDKGLGVIHSLADEVARTWGGTAPIEALMRSQDNLSDSGLRYIRVDSDGVLQGVDSSEYNACIDPITKKWQYIRNGAVMEVPQCDMVAVNDHMKIFNDLHIGRATSQYAKEGHFQPVEIFLTDGVPGCGKTFDIIEKFTTQDMIICAVRDTADDTREQLKQKLLKDTTMSEAEVESFCKSRVRTGDSANMHNVPSPVRKIYVDEGLMMFPGAVLHAAMKARVKSIELYGDSCQIGAIQRGSTAGDLFFSAFFFYTSVIEDNVSKRMAADALYLIAQDYPEHRRARLRTANPILRSIEAIHGEPIKGRFFTVSNPSAAYLSVLQADKGRLLNSGGVDGFIDGKKFKAQGMNFNKSTVRPVYSTHEAQGRTFPEVIVVRMNTQTVGVLDSPTHLVVNLSRHTVRFRYVSAAPAGADALSRRILSLAEVTDETLRAMQVETPHWLGTRIEKHKSFVESTSVF